MGTQINQKQKQKLWAKFIRGEPVDTAPLPPHVVKGWKLSREFGVDPIHPLPPPMFTQEELDKLDHSRDLLDAAAPMLHMLEVSIRNTGYIATLALVSGHLLAVVGDDDLMTEAVRSYNVPGALRSISVMGASALSLSILERRPLHITGCEHYCQLLHEWKCASAPIFDFSGAPLGALAISSHISRKDIHTLTLATSCADGISIRLRENSLLRNQQHLNAMLQSVLNALPEAVITVGENGVITHANNNASQHDAKGRHIPLTGKSIKHIFTPPEVERIRQILESGRPQTVELEVNSPHGPQNRICHFAPVRLDDGNACGMTISITAKSQIIDIAKHAAGNYAKYSFNDIKGRSPGLLAQIDLAKRAAGTGSRVLLTGKSGTGKELFAQAIHNSSAVSNGPFVAISCAAIPRDLIESELFGYVGGAFTGARRNGMIGKIELASGGTLFLDEVNSLPLEMQAKLLRCLQQREVVRIGDTKPTPVEVRIIAATNVNLMDATRQGTFREDLYYRLNVVEIVIPPLCERKEDIELLARAILRRQSTEARLPTPDVSPEALEVLCEYSWPGNVRELDNICERALLLSGGDTIKPEHLPAHILSEKTDQAKTPETIPAQQVGRNVDQVYYEAIMNCLKLHDGNLSKAAASLGVARSTLYRKMRKLNIEWI